MCSGRKVAQLAVADGLRRAVVGAGARARAGVIHKVQDLVGLDLRK